MPTMQRALGDDDGDAEDGGDGECDDDALKCSRYMAMMMLIMTRMVLSLLVSEPFSQPTSITLEVLCDYRFGSVG